MNRTQLSLEKYRPARVACALALRMLSITTAMLAACGALAPTPAGAALALTDVVKDSFTGANGTDLNGRTPDSANLPGSTWVRANVGAIQGNRAQSGSDSGIGISIASAGAYTKPTVFQISADLDLNGMTLPSGQNPEFGFLARGITLGFFDASFLTQPDPAPERREPTGIIYSPDGQLIVVRDPAVTVLDRSTALFATTGSHNLSYWVDTTDGSIFDVRFDGAAVNFQNGLATVINVFANAETDVAGFYGGDGGANVIGFVDNFTVAFPEPGSAGVLAVAAAAVFFRRRQGPG